MSEEDLIRLDGEHRTLQLNYRYTLENDGSPQEVISDELVLAEKKKEYNLAVKEYNGNGGQEGKYPLR